MRRPRLAFHLLITLASLASTAGMATAATLEGLVRSNESGESLGFAALQLSGPEDERQLLAGSNGRFRVLDLPAGDYELRVTYLGHRPQTLQLTLGAEEERRIEIALEVEAIQLEAREVRGNRNLVEQEVQTGFVELGSEELARIPAFGESDPVRALQLLPGVQSASDISSGLYVRGGGPDQNLVLLDGVPVYNPTHAFGLFSSFHPDLIEEVSLFKGAYPANYGGRLGSVLDIRSLEGETGDLRGRVGASTIASRASLQGSWGDRRWALGMRRTHLDPLLDVLRRDEPTIPTYWFGDLNAKLSWPHSSGSTEARLYTSRDDLGLEADQDTGVDLQWGNFVTSLSHQRLLGDTRVLTGSLWLSRYHSSTELSFLNTPADFSNRLLDVGAEARFSWRLPPHHRLQIGATVSRYDFLYDQSFNLDEQIDFGAEAIDAALFVEDLWRPIPETTVRLGLRNRYLSDGDRVRLEPRLSLRQALSEDWTLKLGGGIYHQVLQLVSTEGFSGTDFYLPIDETVDPSRSIQVVGGLEWDLSRTWQASAELYYTDLQNLVVLDNESAADQDRQTAEEVFVTGGEGWASGLELFLQRRVGDLTGWVGYTLGWTRRSFEEIDRGREFPPKYDRRHDVSVVLRYRSGPWDWGASFVYGTGQAFTPAAARYGIRNPATGGLPEFGYLLPADRNSSRLLPYHRLDLSVRRQFGLFGQKAWWNLQFFNAYSRRNDWFVTYDDEEPSATPEIVQQLPIIPSLGIEVEF